MWLVPSNDFNGIELEFLQADDDIEAYLNVYTMSFPNLPGDSRHVEFQLEIMGQLKFFVAELLTGGQKACVPDEIKNAIILSLLNDEPVGISAGKYKEILVPNYFYSVYHKIKPK